MRAAAPAKYLLPVMVILPLIFLLTASGGVIAHAAHLGGTLGGIAYIHLIIQSNSLVLDWRPFRRAPRQRELVSAHSPKRARWPRAQNISDEELPPSEFISREVDPILDKISAHGIQSLTDHERKILEAARKKMSKR